MDFEGGKRKHQSSLDESAIVLKKQKTMELIEVNQQKTLIQTGPPRTSSLESPIMLLTGHQGEIYSVRFSPDGNAVASSSFDKTIFLWNVFGECINYGVLRGHQNAVLEIQWSTDGCQLYSASADKTAAVWDVNTQERVKKLNGHSAVVNSISSARRGPQLLVTASDDGNIKLWDVRVRGCQKTFSNKFPTTAVCFNDTSDGFFSGGLDNDIKYWDIRKGEVSYLMSDHIDTITGLTLSPDGCYLLSNAMDCSVRVWDIRRFAPANRCIKVFTGAEHNFEKNLLRCAWSPDGSKITAGSSDRFVYIWNSTNRQITYRLPGHLGSVNDVQFHPTQPILASCSSDKSIYFGEIVAY